MNADPSNIKANSEAVVQSSKSFSHRTPVARNILSTHFVDDDDLDDLFDDLNNENGEKQQSSSKRFKDSGRIEILTFNTPLTINGHSDVQNGQTSRCDKTNSPTSHTPTHSNANSTKKDISNVNIWNDNLIESATPRRAQYRVIFEVIKARTITNPNDRQKYVNYTILMKRVPGLETEPAVIERRYSEFRQFHQAIRRKYPVLFRDIIFPKKILIGNFSAEVIAERSQAFQRFLTFCLSLPEIRYSREFATFLYYPELREAKNCLKAIRLEEAAAIFENVYYIQSKLSIQQNGQPNAQLIHTLCCLIACLNAVDNQLEAKKLATKTFELLFENPVILIPRNNGHNNNNNVIYQVNHLYEISPLVLPLILLSLRHGWFSGRQKQSLEDKLEELCRQRSLPRNFDSHPKMLELILKKDFSPFI